MTTSGRGNNIRIQLLLFSILVLIKILNLLKAVLYLGNAEIWLLLISHDGNLSTNPTNVLNDNEFEMVKNEIDWKLTWFINVTYSDDFIFKRTDENIAAANVLKGFAIWLHFSGLGSSTLKCNWILSNTSIPLWITCNYNYILFRCN